MKNKPAYAVDSVDHALHLVTLLHHEGPLRVTDAAERLGVSVSTAHRLLAMLVYRDFAEQQPDRRYRAGSALRYSAGAAVPASVLRQAALPHLTRLTAQVGESANLILVVGTSARFLATTESKQILRVGDRSGRSLRAHLTSGGQAVLASRTPSAVRELYNAEADVDIVRLARELAQVRRRGFAINDQRTEAGLTAIGMAIGAEPGEPTAAISIALPSARFRRDLLPGWVHALGTATRGVETALIEG